MVSQLEDYEVLNIIGTGSFGTCYKVRKKSDGNVYVWKAIDYGNMPEERKQLLVSEVNLLSELRHPNIVRYYDRILHRESTTLYIIMEYCQGGDLASLIKKFKQTSSYADEEFVWRVLYQTGKALQICHSRLCHMTVVHRDIKPANVFLDGSGNVKLGDFGLARILRGENSYSETIVGTPYYMSPEIIKGTKYNRKSDIWALGCLVYELCALKPPFVGANLQQLATNITDGLFVRIPQHYSDDLQKIIELMLSVNHDYRPTVEMILHHPTVVLHIPYRTIAQQGKHESKKCTDKTKHTACKLDFKEVTEKINALKLLDREPHDVSEDTFQEKWLTKLEALRQKEANLRMKEEGLCYKERQLLKKEKQLSLMERSVKEKMSRAEVYLRQCKSTLTSVSVKSTRLSTLDEDFDTSYSADPGDTSVLPTSAKLHTEFLQPLNRFNRTGSLRTTKHVHFNQIFEIQSADTTLPYSNTNLIQKPSKLVENIGCLNKKCGLILKNAPSLTAHNDEAPKKKIANSNKKLWIEDKSLELEKKNLDKENLDIIVEKEDRRVRKKCLKYDTCKTCPGRRLVSYR